MNPQRPKYKENEPTPTPLLKLLEEGLNERLTQQLNLRYPERLDWSTIVEFIHLT